MRTAPARRRCCGRSAGWFARRAATSASTTSSLVGRAPEDVARLGVGHVPEGRGVIEEFTVEENLRLGALHGKQSLSDGLADQFDLFPVLGERRRQHAGTLSGGERQMLAMARALIAKPSVLLLDEPSLGLAPIVTADLMRTIKELCESRDAHRDPGGAGRHVRAPGLGARRRPPRRQGRGRRHCRGDRRRREPPSATTSGWPSSGRVPHLSRRLRPAGRGSSSGVIIGLIALSLVLIWRSTHILNFAQGAMAMFAAYVRHVAALLQRRLLVVLRRRHRRGPSARRRHRARPRAPALRQAGDQPHRRHGRVPRPARGARRRRSGARAPRRSRSRSASSTGSSDGKTVVLSPIGVFTIVVAVVVTIGIAALFRFTNLGLQLRASAVAPEVSRLLGVRVGRMLTLGWVLVVGRRAWSRRSSTPAASGTEPASRPP